MKKILIGSLICLTTNCFAAHLQNYSQVKEAIISGKEIRVYVDYAKCTNTEKKLTAAKNVSILIPNKININTEKDEIIAETTHFSVESPAFLGMPIYEFSRYIIAEDGSLTLTESSIDAQGYTKLGNKMTYNCSINEGVRYLT